MEITRETDYAIRCVLHLSEAPNNVIMVDEIVKAKSIPKGFLSKILQKLAKANIVKSYRGVRGGFQIAKAPNHCLTFNPKTINNIIIKYYKNISIFMCTSENISL
ncbi:RrF2 family transcriptional regulator [Dissulfurispira sp.]|uniref:RrF2 family transcriptional regulator n=1 Tax=Dissulfurispira sp. TaxID=2817609 RepID=UPI002FD96CA0